MTALEMMKIHSNPIVLAGVGIKHAKKETKEFIQNNHIQGNVAYSLSYGLYFEDELVQIITFGKSRFNKNYEWEILRSCTKMGYNIIGGFSKLLKCFKNEMNF